MRWVCVVIMWCQQTGIEKSFSYAISYKYSNLKVPSIFCGTGFVCLNFAYCPLSRVLHVALANPQTSSEVIGQPGGCFTSCCYTAPDETHLGRNSCPWLKFLAFSLDSHVFPSLNFLPTILDKINGTSGPPLPSFQWCQKGAFLLFRTFIIALGGGGEGRYGG